VGHDTKVLVHELSLRPDNVVLDKDNQLLERFAEIELG
jgi:hypothetical protein